MKLLKNMVKNVDIVIEILYYTYEYEWTCISCGFDVIKTKHELSKIQRKRKNFINQ